MWYTQCKYYISCRVEVCVQYTSPSTQECLAEAMPARMHEEYGLIRTTWARCIKGETNNNTHTNKHSATQYVNHDHAYNNGMIVVSLVIR